MRKLNSNKSELKKELTDLYHNKNMTLREIADRFKFSHQYIQQEMEKLGIPRIKRGNKNAGNPVNSLKEYFKNSNNRKSDSYRVLQRFTENKCCECGSKKNIHIHHIQEPATSIDDIKILCASCHRAEHQKGINITKQLKICDEYREHKDIKKIAKKYQIANSMAYQILRKHKVKMYNYEHKKPIITIKLYKTSESYYNYYIYLSRYFGDISKWEWPDRISIAYSKKNNSLKFRKINKSNAYTLSYQLTIVISYLKLNKKIGLENGNVEGSYIPKLINGIWYISLGEKLKIVDK
jgi:predicted DNA-binding protein YlxM (UPF0122 family)